MLVELIRLGVNIDHVATLRQQRDERYQSIQQAAAICLMSGADQITAHLRQDRRHIQDQDLSLIQSECKRFSKPFNLEIGSDPQIVAIAQKVKAEWVCLVPENRQEKTTEGGLNLRDANVFKKTKESIKKLHDVGSQISLFIEADKEVLELASELKADAVEIHTGEYSIEFNRGRDFTKELLRFEKGKALIPDTMGYHAGHGITLENLTPLLKLNVFSEYNIGHYIIAQAVFNGLGSTVRQFKEYLTRINHENC